VPECVSNSHAQKLTDTNTCYSCIAGGKILISRRMHFLYIAGTFKYKTPAEELLFLNLQPSVHPSSVSLAISLVIL